MVKGESKSPKRNNSKNKLDESSASSTSTRNSRQKLSESFPEVGRRIKVYKNGEPYDQGITFVLNMRKTHDIGTFLDLVTSRIGLVQGAKKLYTLDGKLVKKTDELVNGKEYVASSGSFIPLPYGKKKAERESSSTSIRTISRIRASSTGPTTRSKSIEIKQKKVPTMNGTSSGNGNGVVGNGGGTFGRSKSQVSLKGKTNSIPNGHAKIVTPVTTKRTLVKKSSLPSGTQTTTKKVTNVIGKANGPAGTKTTAATAATKVEKKVEKTKKQGKKKVKEVTKEEGALIVGGGAVAAGAAAIAASEIIKHKSPTPSPSPPPPPPKTPIKSPSPQKKTPSPKDSPRPKTVGSRPITAASKKDESEEDEKEESDRESIIHHNHEDHHEHNEEENTNEKSESSEGRSETASETEEEEEDDDHIERTESEGSGRPGTAASRASRRGSLKSNKSVKSHHGSDHK